MSKDRMWTVGAIAGMLVIALGGWFLGISPVLTQTSAANAQTAAISARNTASITTLATLKGQFAHLAAQKKILNTLRESIPEEANASAFLDELNTLSIQYAVTIDSVTVAASTIYQSPEAAAAAAAPAASTSTDTPTPSASPAATTPAATPVVPAATGGQFVMVPVLISASGTFDNLRDFLSAVQLGSRLYLATTAQIAAAQNNSDLPRASIGGFLFTQKGTSDVPAAKVKISGATPSPTPTATSTPSATPSVKPTTPAKQAPVVVPTPTPTPPDDGSGG